MLTERINVDETHVESSWNCVSGIRYGRQTHISNSYASCSERSFL